MEEVWTEGHRQCELTVYRQGLRREPQNALTCEESRLRTARRRSRETEGQAASRRESEQERLCLTIRKWPFLKRREVQVFPWRNLRVTDPETSKIKAEPQERSDKVEWFF